MEKTKMNHFIGIRTPWTLSNEEVWGETHKKGGYAFKISGAIALLGFFFPDYLSILIIGSLLITTTYTVFLSYIIYKRVVGKKK